MFDSDRPLCVCTAQQLAIALMMHQRDPITMGQVIDDLEAHCHCWHSFALGPALPPSGQVDYPGLLICLRDLGICWIPSTLYLLAHTAAEAKTLKAIARQWDCAKVVIHTHEQTQQWVGQQQEGVVVVAHWQQPSIAAQGTNFERLYHIAEPPVLPDTTKRLGTCSPQALMAQLLRRCQHDRLDAEAVLSDVYAHTQWWRSFVVGPALPDRATGLRHRLAVLRKLPHQWCCDCLYLWARDRESAAHLQQLCQRWNCTEIGAIEGDSADRLLDVQDAAPIVVASWQGQADSAPAGDTN